jgi:peptidoglycan/LPS O-acetylase OafA/YrhL
MAVAPVELGWDHAALHSLGTYSYGLYVWHYPIVGLLYGLLVQDGKPPMPMGSYLAVYGVSVVATSPSVSRWHS